MKLKLERDISLKILLRLLFLCIPTIIVVAFALFAANQYYMLLNNQNVQQTILFGVGLFAACILFSHRLRFLPISIILLIAYFIIEYIIANIAFVEFDTFLYQTKFNILGVMFGLGWLCGWGFARLRYFPIFLAVLMIVVTLIMEVSQPLISFARIFKTLIPVIAFGFYIIYVSEAIRNMTDYSRAKFFTFLRNMLGILALFLLIMFIISLLMKPTFSKIEESYGDKSRKQNENGLLERSSDSTYKMKNKMGTNPTFDSGKGNPAPMFVAYIDDYLDAEKTVPNPYYFVEYYLTDFDTYTETFERDSVIPYDDLFKPVPSEIEMYFPEVDSAIMKTAQRDSLTKIVNIDVYNINLSPKEFTAPLTSFFCQPIAVDKNTQFKTAYRTKSVVSALNSAYLVYPSRDKDLMMYQLARYEMLANVRNFDDLPEQFYKYYTHLPQSDFIDSVKNLTAKLTAHAQTPIEKIVAIRNFFFAHDDMGEPLFKYTENPGIPGIPSASKLAYFLFDSHRGYCAHFAGATLFMLRACGIPARLTVGFATVDRSDKNRGWYWFYEDQAHAWVQVYFPKFGWLDFDNTVGNENQQDAPQPDGTPPLEIRKAYFAGSGEVVSVDTIAKIIDFKLSKMIFHDNKYRYMPPKEIRLDMNFAKITQDSLTLALTQITNGSKSLALSFNEKLKNIMPNPSQSKDAVLNLVPQPVPVDEFKVESKTVDQKNDKQKNADKKDAGSKFSKWIIFAIVLFVILLLLFAAPYLIFRWFRAKSKLKTQNVDTFYVYKTSTFLLNQLGCERGTLTPLQYAEQKVDAKYGSKFAKFMIIYLRMKYSNQQISEADKAFVQTFYPDFENRINQNHKFSERLKRFLNLKQTIKYWF